MACNFTKAVHATPSTQTARKPFKPNKITKNSLQESSIDAKLKRLCELGRVKDAVDLLEFNVRPNTLAQLIDSCVEAGSLELCYYIHTRLKKVVENLEPFLETKLVGMYSKCGSLSDAYEMFDQMRERDLYAWSSMIGACSREKRWVDVVELSYSMMREGCLVPDEFLFPKILQACGNIGDIETCRAIHAMTVKFGISSGIRIGNSILAVYSKSRQLNWATKFFEKMEVKDRVSWNAMITGLCWAGEISEAQRLIDSMLDKGIDPDVVTWNILIATCSQLARCDEAMKLMNEMERRGLKPDVVTWSSMISGFSRCNRRIEGLRLFKDMVISGVTPNDVALLSILSVCTEIRDLKRGEEIHSVATKLGYGEDVLVGNTLVDLYSKCGKIKAARLVFDRMLRKDGYTWNSMIGAYCQAGYCGVAHDLFKEMQRSDILPNVVTWNVLITGYIQNGDEDRAMDLFHGMEKVGGVKRDTASWNALIAGYVQLGEKNKALGIFRQMQSYNFKPNSVTILSILPACANLIAVNKLKEIHGCIIRSNLESELSVANSLIGTYAKSGNLKYSNMIFNLLPSLDIITWNSMITAYVGHGCYNEAIELFERMTEKELKPNRSTFASIITAYAQAKMIDEGKRIFSMMSEGYKIAPSIDHYVAMVNLYGRLGKLDEAYDFINGMTLQPDVSIWSALLTACLRRGNVRLAIIAGERLLDLESDNTFVQKTVAKLIGISNDSTKTKVPGSRKDAAKTLGTSWIEENNKVRTFVSGDVHRFECESMQCWIESIENQIKGLKYHETLSVHDEEEESGGMVHSEKLAMASALIRYEKTSQKTIRIVKNLRMCDNCHVFVKSVSEIEHECDIFISDSRCLHHFKHGECSCGDYW